jgi:serine/threonine protein kinase
MHHSSLVLFCDECGLANDPAASQCAFCQHPLAHARDEFNTLPVLPITGVPPVLAVLPGPLFALDNQGTLVALPQYPTCDFRPGSILAGRYQILEEIGRGGFSVVYRAVDQRDGSDRRLVAIKRIQLDQLSPRQAIDATETFHREIAMLPRLAGVSGIPAYYEHLTDAQNWYLITQYIEGQTLEEYLQKAPGGYLDEKETIEVGIGLAELLQKLHASEPPVIFRDLKPANIMLTPNEGFFLIDFGIARTFLPGKTKDTTPLGSPGYAPPEQYGRSQTDQRSDIYSLGATLQTLLTGRDPLELRNGESSRNPQAPSRGLRKLLDEMLSVEAAQRPAGMSQIKKRLEFLQKWDGRMFPIS